MTIVCYILIVLMPVISFFLSIGKESKASKKSVQKTELDYLYDYRAVLLKLLQIEKQLQDITVTADEDYTHKSDVRFNPVEALSVKQDIETNMKQQINKYEQGATDVNTLHNQLNQLYKRLITWYYPVTV